MTSNPRATPRRTVVFVLKGYPRLSETFIAQEILELERRGLDIRIVSLRRPYDPVEHPIHREIRAPRDYLPEYLHDDWARVRRAWRAVRRWPGYRAALRAWLADLVRDPSRNRVRRFGQALVLAHELPEGAARLHAHFLHTPASVARYAAMVAGLSWSCSAHAKDIWTTPAWEKRRKLADVDWLTTCTKAGRDHLAALAPDATRVRLAYHGLDLARFPPPPGRPSMRDGEDPDAPVRLVTVGRAVPKKGYDVLLDALAMLPVEVHWRLVHIGGGELREALAAQATRLGLERRIVWRGPLPQDSVLGAYRAADLFVLPSRIARDGDRDGLPNVLMEAASQRLPVLSTRVSAIPEFVIDGETGVLVPSDDARRLSEALLNLIRDPMLRQRLGAAGEARLRAFFAAEPALDPLAELFGLEEEKCASPSTLP